MKLIRTGSQCQLESIRDREGVFALLSKYFSYKVEGAKFSPQFRAHVWDGKIKLVHKARGEKLVFPGGLADEVLEILRTRWEEAVEVEDLRPTHPPLKALRWAGPSLRDYQEEAVAKAVSAGAGVLKLPIRSGKTITAARIIWTLSQRALFVVTSDLLLRQATEVFRRVLPDASVTVVGAGEWDSSGDIVVATVQTLQKNNKTRAFVRLARSFGVVIFDEIHHLQGGSGDEWRDTALAIDSRSKFGLSATIDLRPTEENAAGDIWLRGICGPVLIEKSMSDLIRLGYLVPPVIRFLRYEAPEIKGKWTPAMYSEAVAQCEPRNRRIVRAAADYAKEGKGVLIDVSRVAHARTIYQAAMAALPPGQVALLLGSSSASVREKTLKAFRTRKIMVLVSTILGEGVDVPEIDVVINGEGGRGKTTTIQRLRNLTPAEWKKRAVVVELVDVHHAQLAEWTKARLKTYREEPAFCFDIEEKG